MSTEAITDADVVEEPGTAVAVQQQAPATIFKTDDPMEIMQRTTEVAGALKQFIGAQGLVSKISGRDYIVVEGWQMLGMMLGVTPGNVTTTAVAEGWQSVVELHDRSGRVVGMGEAECLATEKTWKSREDYARKSMAQTRAIAKAYRNTFGFIAKAAGFEATPAEEMPTGAPAAEPPASPEGQQRLRTGLGLAYGLPKDDPAVMSALEKIRESACDGPLTVPVLNGVMRCLADLLAHRQEQEKAA